MKLGLLNPSLRTHANLVTCMCLQCHLKTISSAGKECDPQEAINENNTT